MPFEFIDNNARIDRATRKRIRSLAATGKNAGKTVVRPSKIKAFKEQQSRQPTIIFSRTENKIDGKENKREEKSLEIEIVSRDDNTVVPEIERQIDDELCILSAWSELSPTSKGLARRAIFFISGPRHSPELSGIFQSDSGPVSSWVRLMFESEAFFHCSIALSTAVINSQNLNQNNSREELHHLCQTFRLVNEQLSKSRVVPSSTIATVMMLAQYERHHSQHYQGLVHLNGLQRLINMRGGILEIKKDLPLLMQKAFRIDLDYALYMGTTTMFRVEQLIASGMLIPEFGRTSSTNGAPNTPGFKEISQYLSPDLYNILLDTTFLAWRLNDVSAAKIPKINAYAFNGTIILLGYRVISISSLAESSYQLSRIENAIHLGLAMFVTTFMNKLDRKIPEMPFLAESLRSSLLSNNDDGPDYDRSVLLWILFLGEAAVLNHFDYEWLVPMVAKVARELGLFTWDDVLGALLKFPWVNVLYNKSAQALWDMVYSHHAFKSSVNA